MPERIAALGEQALVQGFGLAGAVVCGAETDDEVRRAWAGLAGSTAVVILTARAARALGDVLHGPQAPLSVVLPS